MTKKEETNAPKKEELYGEGAQPHLAPTPPPKAPPTPKPSPAEDLISKANAAAARQEEANTELTKQLDRQEAMKVEQTLGGEAEAGSREKTEDEKVIEDARKLLGGTGFAEELFPNETLKKPEPPKD